MNPYENTYAPKKRFPFAILAGVLIVASLGLAGGSVYFNMERDKAKLSVEGEQEKVATKKKAELFEKYQNVFNDDVAKTTRTFESSSDFGAVKFDYPEEWSVYVDKDGSKTKGDGDTTTYTAYLSPGVIEPVTEKLTFLHALDIRISKGTIADVKERFKGHIEDGLVSWDDYALRNDYTLQDNKNGIAGIRMSGQIIMEDDLLSGTVLMFEIRDKVLQIYIMQSEYLDSINSVVLNTLRWKK